MTRALRSVSSEKGRDPREFALIAYGGAGPVHAVGLAEELGCRDGARARARRALQLARAALRAAGVPRRAHVPPRRAHGRRRRRSTRSSRELAASARRASSSSRSARAPLRRADVGGRDRARRPGRPARPLIAAFEDEHERLYGSAARTARRSRSARCGSRRSAGRARSTGSASSTASTVRTRDARRRCSASCRCARAPRSARAREPGPLLIDEYDTTVVVRPGWTVRRDAATETLDPGARMSTATRSTRSRRRSSATRSRRSPTRWRRRSSAPRTRRSSATAWTSRPRSATPTARRSRRRSRFRSTSARCRTRWRRCSRSGATGCSPGDVFVMNDPFDGGIHLQDIFVFKPVFLDDELIGFATTTAHHGDVGGRLPGSAACDNTEIFQEGIRLPWLQLYDRGEPVERDLRGDPRERADPADDARRPRRRRSPRRPSPSARCRSSRARYGAERLAGADDRPDRAHRAARPQPRSPAGPTAPRRSPTTSTPTASSGATSRSPRR